METILEGLENQISTCYQTLNSLVAGSDEYNAVAKNLDNLLTQWNTIRKCDDDIWTHGEQVDNDKEKNRIAADQLAFDKSKDKKEKISNWIDLGIKGLTLATYLFVAVMVMDVEQGGTIRSKAFPGIFPKTKL